MIVGFHHRPLGNPAQGFLKGSGLNDLMAADRKVFVGPRDIMHTVLRHDCFLYGGGTCPDAGWLNEHFKCYMLWLRRAASRIGL